MPRLLCFIPAPKQNRTPHRNTTPNLQRPTPPNTSRHDVPTNQKRRRPPAPHRISGSHNRGTAMVLYAYLRHALSGCNGDPRPSLPLLSRGLPVNVCFQHTLPFFFTSRWLVVARQCDGAAMHLTQNTFTTYHSTSTSDIYTRHGVIRVPPARFWGVTRTHDRCCAPQSWATK